MTAQYTNSLQGLIEANDANNFDINVSDLLLDAPFLRRIAAVPASEGGTVHKYMKTTVAAGVSFRDINTGVTNAASKEEQQTITLKLMDASLIRDKALAMAYRKGASAYMEKQMMYSLQASFANAEKQLIYGTGNNATGWSGLAQLIADLNDSFCVNAGGTTPSTGSSCWVMRTNEEAIAAVMGYDGLIDVGEIFETSVNTNTSDAALRMSALGLNILTYMGLQAGSNYDLVRIANLTADSGKGLTDALIAEAISRFPASRKPNLIVCNTRSWAQLQKSKTATTTTGAPAPFPESSFEIPIVVTDQIVNTETLLGT